MISTLFRNWGNGKIYRFKKPKTDVWKQKLKGDVTRIKNRKKRKRKSN